MNKKILVLSILATLVMLCCFYPEAWAQCAMCKSSAESNLKSGYTSVVGGLNVGILYLLSMPYLAISVIAFLWYKKNKKKRLHGTSI